MKIVEGSPIRREINPSAITFAEKYPALRWVEEKQKFKILKTFSFALWKQNIFFCFFYEIQIGY